MSIESGRRIVGLALLASASAFLTAGITGGLLLARTNASVDPCAAPAGMTLDGLDAHQRGLVVRRLFACQDLQFGRISEAGYRSTIDSIDSAWIVAPPPLPPATMWESSVRGFSTQYSASSGSAARVLGPPDVFPQGGANPNARASPLTDGRHCGLDSR